MIIKLHTQSTTICSLVTMSEEMFLHCSSVVVPAHAATVLQLPSSSSESIDACFCFTAQNVILLLILQQMLPAQLEAWFTECSVHGNRCMHQQTCSTVRQLSCTVLPGGQNLRTMPSRRLLQAIMFTNQLVVVVHDVYSLTLVLA